MGIQQKASTDLRIWKTCSPSATLSRRSSGDAHHGRRRAQSTSGKPEAVPLPYQRERWLPVPQATVRSYSNRGLSSPVARYFGVVLLTKHAFPYFKIAGHARLAV